MNPARSALRLAALLAALVAVLSPARTALAEPVALSALPRGSDTLRPATGRMRLTDIRRVGENFVTQLDAPVCVRTPDMLEGRGEAWVSPDAWLTSATTPALVVERLVTGPEPALELTRVETMTISDTDVAITGRARIALMPIGTPDVPMYAYRGKDAVHVFVPRGFDDPAFAVTDPRFSRECAILHLVLHGAADSRHETVTAPHPLAAWARFLSDTAPFEKRKASQALPTFPAFAVSVSVSKVSRDPEPIVSVTVRALRPPEVASVVGGR